MGGFEDLQNEIAQGQIANEGPAPAESALPIAPGLSLLTWRIKTAANRDRLLPSTHHVS